MKNYEIAQIFTNIAGLLEIKGEVIYKILAYRRAGENLREFSQDVAELWRQGRLREIPGVGQAIADKIDELLSTGRLGFYDRLQQEVPLALLALTDVPDVGPKKAALIWKQLGVTNVEELEAAARAGKLRSLPGMGEKSEAKILAGIASLARRDSERRPAGMAWPVAQQLLEFLRALPGVKSADIAGSLRRRRSTVRDLDFLVAARKSEAIMEAYCSHPMVARVLGSGPTKSSVELGNGLQADLRVLPPERFGTALQYFTGSKEHNVRVRELALKHGLSLNEHALTRADGSEILCATEAQVYRRLGLEYIPPELREDRGEIEAALRGELPTLIDLDDIHLDLHAHTIWSDGTLSVLELAQAARARGLKCLAITDHSQSLGIASGLTPERLREQRVEIDAAQRAMGGSLRLLQGAEVEIKPDGTLDYADEVLAGLDIVIASLHTGLRQEREQATARLLRAIANPHVDIIGHPTGRMFPNRVGADLDMEAVLRAAADADVALEINAHPARLDLDDVHAHRALELGCRLTINTDTHHPDNFDLLHFGVGVARRAWATPGAVINTWAVGRLVEWLAGRGKAAGAPPAAAGIETAAADARPAARRVAKPAAKKAATKVARKTPARPARKRRG